MEKLFIRGDLDWEHFLSALVLAMVRMSGLIATAPFFSSAAIPKQIKAVFVLAVSILIVPVVAALPMAHAELGVISILGELSAGLIFGFSLTLLNEIQLFAGQVLGIQFSFSLANLLDPNSQVETPLLAQIFSLMGVSVLIVSGLDRTMMAALMRSYSCAPLGGVFMNGEKALTLVPMVSGVFFAALQLSAPVLAATMLVEITVALMGKLSPQLPVMAITVPVKIIVGYVLLLGSLALWPQFIERHFVLMIDVAENTLCSGVRHP